MCGDRRLHSFFLAAFGGSSHERSREWSRGGKLFASNFQQRPAGRQPSATVCSLPTFVLRDTNWCKQGPTVATTRSCIRRK
jgi:hypothetical protein